MFCKKGVLRNFAKFIGKHLCESLFFNKVACLSFPLNCAKLLRTPFLTEHLWWLLLYFEKYCSLHYIAQRYHPLYFKFIVYFIRALIFRCTSYYWQFFRKQWLVKSYPILFCLQILNHITY